MWGRMRSQDHVLDLLRQRLIGELHIGRLKPGDRAPSLRTVARELGVGIRAVSRAYAQLQDEGLVTIRHRSGIYMSELSTQQPELDDTQAWYSDVLCDAWTRRIPLRQLPDLLERFVSQPMRCACLESTRDHLVAFCAELSEDFGLETSEVLLRGDDSADDVDLISAALLDCDVAVTTTFHIAQVRPIAQALGRPVIVIPANDALIERLRESLRERPVALVIADPRFRDRVNQYLARALEAEDRLVVLQLEEFTANAERANGAQILITRAARDASGVESFHLFPSPLSFISRDAARQLTRFMVAASVLQAA